jgi:hypothetical protein
LQAFVEACLIPNSIIVDLDFLQVFYLNSSSSPFVFFYKLSHTKHFESNISMLVNRLGNIFWLSNWILMFFRRPFTPRGSMANDEEMLGLDSDLDSPLPKRPSRQLDCELVVFLLLRSILI